MNKYKVRWVDNSSSISYKIHILWWKFKRFFTKWKIVNSTKYDIVSVKDRNKSFKLSEKEYEASQKIYKTKGTISYEFIPSGIGWGVKIHVLNTHETIDITDYNTW